MTRVARRTYRRLLRVFPGDFRRRHGAQMLAQFESQQAAIGRKPVALVAFWYRATVDAVVHGLAARRDRRAAARAPRRTIWTADLRQALRGLRRDRGVTAAMLGILTAGIAATTIMFGVVDRLLLRPPAGVVDAETVRRVHFGTLSRPGQAADRHSYPVVTAIRQGVPGFAGTAATHLARVTLGGGVDATQATAQLVDADYFSVLQLSPSAGRFFSLPAAPDEPSVVLSHAFWRGQYAADDRVIGQPIRIDGRSLTIAGVGPAGFKGLEPRPIDLWVSTPALAPALLGAGWASNAGRFAFGLIVRMAPQASIAVADEQATAALRAATADRPMVEDTLAFTAPLRRLESPGGILAEGHVALWLLGVSVLVLLVAMANVGGLLLTRAWSRRRDVAVRLALGASRARLLRQNVIESALLAAMAATAALGVTWLSAQIVRQTLLPGFAWPDGIVDGRVLGLSLAIALLTAFGLGVLPSLQLRSSDALGALRVSARVAPGRAARWRAGLLVLQIALSVVLLVGTGLFVRSLIALRAQDVGVDLDRVIVASVPFRPGQPPAGLDALYADAATRLASLADVERVTIARGTAPMALSVSMNVARDGWTDADLKGRPAPLAAVVAADYFATLGASLERGRGFTIDDERSDAAVVVINRALAATIWPDVDPVGQCARLGGPNRPCSTIVGVVENILSFDRVDPSRAQLYLLPSHPQAGRQQASALVIRVRRGAEAAVPVVRQVVRSLRADMPYVDVSTLATLSAPQLQPWRIGATMFSLFGAVALAIAAVGLFSAMAHAVAQRQHEIGIRMALGASPWRVVTQVGRHGAGIVVAGTALGLGAAALFSGRIADLLHQTSPRDPVVYVAVAAVMLVAGLAAAVLPARRSTNVDPLIVLKTE